jgi:hypothetical protein
MMKTMKMKVFVFSMMMLAVLAGCSKDDKNDADLGSGTVTVTINGKKTELSNLFAGVLDNKVNITATENVQELSMMIDGSIDKGTYNYDSNEPTVVPYVITYAESNKAVFTTVTNVTKASLTITSHDQAKNKIKGSFTLTYLDNETQEPHQASGSFEVTYTDVMK